MRDLISLLEASHNQNEEVNDLLEDRGLEIGFDYFWDDGSLKVEDVDLGEIIVEILTERNYQASYNRDTDTVEFSK